MKKKILGISIIMALFLLFVFYGDILTGCRKKDLPPQPPEAVIQPIQPQPPQAPQVPQAQIKEKIIFDVSYGKVEFTHKRHAETFKISCLKCHHTWEKDEHTGKLCGHCHQKKAAETISSKEAYHKSCKACHDELKKSGKPTGPTGCAQCHVKKK